jgi:uncharacterized protein YbcI
VRGFFLRGSEIRRTGMASPGTGLTGGALNAAISNAVVKLFSEHVGKGPTKARTIHSGKFVLCVLEDGMTKGERSLLRHGKDDYVLSLRHAFQETMKEELNIAVQALTGRKVSAFMSANCVDPDLAAEVFVLEAPVNGEVDVGAEARGRRNGEGSADDGGSVSDGDAALHEAASDPLSD